MGSVSNMFEKAREMVARWGKRPVRIATERTGCPDPRDTSVPPGVMAYTGEDVVCDGPEQHVVATAVEDIAVGDPSDGVLQQFYWFQAPPELGTDILKIKCAKCDGRWVSSGMHLHFKGGWR